MHHIFSEVQHRLWSGIVYTLEEWSIINKPQLKNNCFLLYNVIHFILPQVLCMKENYTHCLLQISLLQTFTEMCIYNTQNMTFMKLLPHLPHPCRFFCVSKIQQNRTNNILISVENGFADISFIWMWFLWVNLNWKTNILMIWLYQMHWFNLCIFDVMLIPTHYGV